MKARVVGLSHDRGPEPARGAWSPGGVISHWEDVRDARAVDRVFARHEPQVVFHLAAQPLVRESYRRPVETYATNVLGTAHVLDAARCCDATRAVVVVTSDKCYEAATEGHAHREGDRLGGDDPYSSSKACAELVTASFAQSFLNDQGKAVATARAGNVIGGGDWAADRLVPDFVRAVAAGEPIVLRRPHAVRPWQHVLDPLHGYLLLARALWDNGPRYAGGWNFGPPAASHVTVAELAAELVRIWGSGEVRVDESAVGSYRENAYLGLDSTKARSELGWQPQWSFAEALQATVTWYQSYVSESAAPAALDWQQIEEYERHVETARSKPASRTAA